MNYSKKIISLLSIIIFSILLFHNSFASELIIRPTNYVDSNSQVTNDGFSYDSNFTTFAILNSINNNFTLISFGTGGHLDSEAIINATITFNLNSSNFSSDTWSLYYTNDSETSWQTLRASSSNNLVKQNLTYEISSYGGWLWSELATNLRARIQTNNITNDNANLNLYELFVKVTYDDLGPQINLSLPLEETSYPQTTLVNFTFNVSDDFFGVENCSLIINNIIEKTNSSITQTSNEFQKSMVNGIYNWKIGCYDNSTNFNYAQSVERTLRIDSEAPTIAIVNPANLDLVNANYVKIIYNVTDVSNMKECSLFINGSLNITKTQSEINWPSGLDEFDIYLEDGNYSTFVNCTDIYDRSNISGEINFSVFGEKAPIISNIMIDPTINLNPASNKTVYCNATITDLNNLSTINNVYAYFHRDDVNYDSLDEIAYHHTNSSCNITNLNSTSAFYDCGFTVPYYSKSMNWKCSFFVEDNSGLITVDYNSTFINPIYSYNVSPEYVSYGLINPGNISDEQTITIQNLGNTEIDLALTGYGVVEGDNLALNCQVGNTTLSNEKYSEYTGTSYASMISLTNSTSYLDLPQLDNFNLPPKNSTFNGQKNIYWKIKLGVPQKGDCQGYLTFVAIAS